MNTFEFARNREKQAEDVYRKLAKTAEEEGITTIFTMLADAERKHYEIILKMEKAEKVEVSSLDILPYVQKTINQMKTREQKFKLSDSQIDIYKEAQAKEVESEKFYLELAKNATDEHQCQIFRALAKEENMHCTILENIVEFISYPVNHPENAEFNNPVES